MYLRKLHVWIWPTFTTFQLYQHTNTSSTSGHRFQWHDHNWALHDNGWANYRADSVRNSLTTDDIIRSVRTVASVAQSIRGMLYDDQL